MLSQEKKTANTAINSAHRSLRRSLLTTVERQRNNEINRMAMNVTRSRSNSQQSQDSVPNLDCNAIMPALEHLQLQADTVRLITTSQPSLYGVVRIVPSTNNDVKVQSFVTVMVHKHTVYSFNASWF
jgi:hypothetical protein